MEINKSIFVFIFCCVSLVYSSNGNVHEDISHNGSTITLRPENVLTYSLEEQLDFTCTVFWNGIRLTSNNTNDVKFYIGYKLPDHEKLSFHLQPSYCHNTYCDVKFNLTFEWLRSTLNSSNNEFYVECMEVIENYTYGEMSSSSVRYSEGNEFGEVCSSSVRCNENANLTCIYNVCNCKETYIAINTTDNKQLCYSKAYHGDSCLYDKQCINKNALCDGDSVENKTCQCIEYYVYNGYYCCSNSSWCSFLWFDYDWFSYYWTDIIVIMIALSLGILILTIVIAFSISLRMRERRTGQQPTDVKYPQNYSTKELFGHYFGKKGEDKQILTDEDFDKN